MVAASRGISIVPESMQAPRPHVVVYRPLRDEPLHALLGVAHRAAESSSAVLNFIEAARHGRSGGASHEDPR